MDAHLTRDRQYKSLTTLKLRHSPPHPVNIAQTIDILLLMAVPEILDMDPLTFSLTMISLLSLIFSALNFLRHYTPTSLYLHAASKIAAASALYRDFEEEGRLTTTCHSELANRLDWYVVINS